MIDLIPEMMTLRDYLACHAPKQPSIMGECEDVASIKNSEDVLELQKSIAYAMRIDAALRYQWADAMLKARAEIF